MAQAALIVIAIMLCGTLGAVAHPALGMAALATVGFVGYQLTK